MDVDTVLLNNPGENLRFSEEKIYEKNYTWVTYNEASKTKRQCPRRQKITVCNRKLISRYGVRQCWGSERLLSDSDPVFKTNSDLDSVPFGSGSESESECVRIRIRVKINPGN